MLLQLEHNLSHKKLEMFTFSLNSSHSALRHSPLGSHSLVVGRVNVLNIEEFLPLASLIFLGVLLDGILL